MTARQLAEELHVVPSTISQWINGKRKPHVKDIERLEAKLGTNGYLKRQLKYVSRETSPEWFEWRSVEEEAGEFLVYETLVIPGLLQTPAYAQAILPSDKVEERLERQQIFDQDAPPFFEALLDESTLYRKVGTAGTMAEQLSRLLELIGRELIIRIVPLSAGLARLTLPFVLATVDGGKQVAFLDGPLRGQITEEPSDIAELRRCWAQAGAAALSQSDSIDLIQRTVKERWSTT